jgi:hypothetical protein
MPICWGIPLKECIESFVFNKAVCLFFHHSLKDRRNIGYADVGVRFSHHLPTGFARFGVLMACSLSPRGFFAFPLSSVL